MSTPVTADLGDFKLTGKVSGEKQDADLTLTVEIEPGEVRAFPVTGSLLTGIEQHLSRPDFQGTIKFWSKKNDTGRYDLYGQFIGSFPISHNTGRRFETQDIKFTTLSLPSDPAPQDGAPLGTASVLAELGPFKLTGKVSGEKLDADLTLSVEVEPGNIKYFPVTGSLLTEIEPVLNRPDFYGTIKFWTKKNDTGRYDLYGQLKGSFPIGDNTGKGFETGDIKFTTLYF